MGIFTHPFGNIDKAQISVVGGKGANLGELSRIENIHVPTGFCISTEAFRKMLSESSSLKRSIDLLSRLKPDEHPAITEIGLEIRSTIEKAAIPKSIWEEVSQMLLTFEKNAPFAIRSSATAEDLPSASFAGQHDTFLNIVGTKAILRHIAKCWASLFTDRAISYRLQNGFDHRQVSLAVVVQQMVFPQVSGIMFTADPVTCNRRVASVDASFGLGEALVSGIVSADNYRIRGGNIIEKKIAGKKLEIAAVDGGGTTIQQIELQRQSMQALTDEQLLLLEQTGRRIEAHFGSPQDVEWCIADDTLYILQSRPITTLYPIPEPTDHQNRVFLSVGHHQMMTDAMKPLGLSLWQLIAAGTRMLKAGGRLFVDVTQMLSSFESRRNLLASMEQFDLLVTDALKTIIDNNFVECPPDQHQKPAPVNSALSARDESAGTDPAIAVELVEISRKSLETLRENIVSRSGVDLLDFILTDIEKLRKSISDPKSMGLIMAAINAAVWINKKMDEWLQEKNAADVLSQSVQNNVTSEMGLKLLDVADAIRPFPEVILHLQQARDENVLETLATVAGGKTVLELLNGFLDQYGMRCAGEIDITRPRWSEKPGTLIPVILNYVNNLTPGESKRRFELGRVASLEKERDLLDRLRRLPDGETKVAETRRRIAMIRDLSGYREYPKYAIISRLFIYKKALMEEAKRLVAKGIIREADDIAYLTFQELREVIKDNRLDHEFIGRRKEEHKINERLSPPRVITSDGEIITGRYKKENLPPDAIVGLAVSSGVVEGRARVVLKMDEADLEEGDILITPFTDPSWTPLFLSVRGLITEVGGLMTHGAVIAREYGLPAIVGVENATKLIKDGQRIRLNGTEGFVEILDA